MLTAAVASFTGAVRPAVTQNHAAWCRALPTGVQPEQAAPGPDQKMECGLHV